MKNAKFKFPSKILLNFANFRRNNSWMHVALFAISIMANEFRISATGKWFKDFSNILPLNLICTTNVILPPMNWPISLIAKSISLSLVLIKIISFIHSSTDHRRSIHRMQYFEIAFGRWSIFLELYNQNGRIFVHTTNAKRPIDRYFFRQKWIRYEGLFFGKYINIFFIF